MQSVNSVSGVNLVFAYCVCIGGEETGYACGHIVRSAGSQSHGSEEQRLLMITLPHQGNYLFW